MCIDLRIDKQADVAVHKMKAFKTRCGGPIAPSADIAASGSLRNELVNGAASAGDGRYCGEPVFVPRANAKSQDDGYILTCVHDLSHPDRDTNCMEVLDALDLEAGPVCRIALHDLVPPGLHGSWSSRVVPQAHGEVLPTSGDVRYNL